MNYSAPETTEEMICEEIGDYVAQLQLHMTLQARNLLPSLVQINDSRSKLLQETQANIEKLASRQLIK